MIWDLFLKIYCTPENIISLILNVCSILSMCFIFEIFNEKWWKSLVPVYSYYILYKHTWFNGYFFLLEFILNIINASSISIIRKHVIGNLLEVFKYYFKMPYLDIYIDYSLIFLWLIIFIITYIIIFILKRITFWKLCNILHVNLFLKLGTLIIPDLFLLIDIIYFKYQRKINDNYN